MTTLNILPPGLVMVLAAFAIVFIPHHLRQVLMIFAILLSAFSLTAGAGVHLTIPLMGQDLILHHADHLTLPFGIIFHIAALINVIYGWHERRGMEHSAGLAYAGAAIAAVHAGDLISLFIWWEMTAITSVFLVLAGGSHRARAASMRYLLVQVASGVMLLAGAAFYWRQSGSWAFEQMQLTSIGTWLIFLSFGIKAAFPLVNAWLQDAYPEATAIGTVILSVFTTKLAIYAFARGFAGVELLIWIGAVMAVFPIIFALLEDDLRRVLSYSLNSQLGFMVVAIGIGSELAINGAVAHAAASIIYKALLFMAMGAVLYRTTSVKASDLGGLYKSMPLTMVFCIIGALSISAFPLFSGYVAKSLISSALSYQGLTAVYMALLFASVATLLHSGIKVPYFAFFNRDAGHKVKDAPINMLIAMAVAAVLCIGIGVFPQYYLQLLPYPIDYQPYDSGHVIGQLQLLVFGGGAGALMLWFGAYRGAAQTVLNSDILYRRLAPMVILPFIRLGITICQGVMRGVVSLGVAVVRLSQGYSSHPLSGPVIPGPASVVQVGLLVLILAVVYIALA